MKFLLKGKGFCILSIIILILILILGSYFFRIEPIYHGKVLDAETNKLIKDVIVFRKMELSCPQILNPAGGVTYIHLGCSETITNKKGSFSLPLKFYLKSSNCDLLKRYTFFKSGYFLSRSKYEQEAVQLYKMKHYLDFIPIRHPREYYPGMNYSKDYKKYQQEIYNLQFEKYDYFHDRFREESKLLKKELKEANKINFKPFDKLGVFIRKKGSQFSKITLIDFKNTLYTFDRRHKSWIKIDSRGNIKETKSENLPYSAFINPRLKDNTLYVFADSEAIYYPINDYKNPEKYIFKKKDFNKINSYKGNISAFVSKFLNYLTIEDNGALLCHYGNVGTEQNFYKRKSETAKSSSSIYFLKSYSGIDLPESPIDDSLEHTEFKFLIPPIHYDFYIVTKTLKYWHVYRFSHAYSGKQLLKEIAYFPKENEITAVGRGDGLYISFKGGFIRKYLLNEGSRRIFKEDKSFFNNSCGVIKKNIKSMICGTNYIYATIGEDVIYRFSKIGIPDRLVEIDQIKRKTAIDIWTNSENISKTSVDFNKRLVGKPTIHRIRKTNKGCK
jgi:hypothetical protein